MLCPGLRRANARAFCTRVYVAVLDVYKPNDCRAGMAFLQGDRLPGFKMAGLATVVALGLCLLLPGWQAAAASIQPFSLSEVALHGEDFGCLMQRV